VHKLLFSFPRGTVGIGLLFARVLSGLGLLARAALAPPLDVLPVHLLSVALFCSGGVLQLLGLWTRVVSALIALGSAMYLLFHFAQWWHGILLVALNLTLTVLGPGAWSLDSRRSGWKRIEIPKR